MKAGIRQKVWLKYDKHCAYCGKVLAYKDMQVDHLIPQRLAPYYISERARAIIGAVGDSIDSFENLMPACRRCNHYKRWRDLKEFRILMLELHTRINDTYIVKVGRDYGMVPVVEPFDGTFYFERGMSL